MTSNCNLLSVVTLLLLLPWLENGVKCLHNVDIVVPSAVLLGETVILECNWDMDDDEALYSVKWYRGREEFYRYIPKELPHTRVFPLKGIDIDISKSGARRVVLKAAQPSMAGRFRCEVSADAPTFHTEIRSAHLTVVEPPAFSPKLIARRHWYGSGINFEALCAVPPAYPPPNITWLLNGEEIETGPSIHKLPDAFIWDIPTTTTAISKEPTNNLDHEQNHISYHDYGVGVPEEKRRRRDLDSRKQRHAESEKVPTLSELKHSVPNNMVVKLTCMATIYNLYSARSEFAFEVEQPEVASVLGVRNSGCNTAMPTALMCVIIFCLYVQNL